MFIFKLLSTVSLIAYTMANPVSRADTALAKRAEGIHLVNCDNVYSVVVVRTAIPFNSTQVDN